jgi:Tfp pilus assembly PilM family ATPase
MMAGAGVFGRENVVGLDIGDGLITAACVRGRRNGRLDVTHVGWEEYDPGATDQNKAAAIRRLWRRQEFPALSVCSCLRSPSLTLKPFKYTGLPQGDLAPTLRLQAEEALQMPQNKIAVDWQVFDRAPAGNLAVRAEASIDGLLVAAPRVEVERHLALLGAAGLCAVVLDVGTLAVCNLFSEIGQAVAPSTAACLVNLGRRTADVAILYEGNFVYPRNVFSRAADWETVPDQLVGHLQDMLKYSRFKLRPEPVMRVLLCGRVPAGTGFLQTLSEGVAMPVERWNPVNDMDLRTKASRALTGKKETMGPALAACLGLALRSS